MQDSVLDRLTHVLGDRTLHGWGKSLGLSDGKIQNMRKGKTPDPELLSILSRTENVNINWLLTGDGAPFKVHAFTNGDDLQDYLSTALEDEPWRIIVVESYPEVTVVLHQPGQIDFAKRTIDYHVVEVLTGSRSKLLIEFLEQLARAGMLEVVQACTSLNKAEIRLGMVGPYWLFGNNDSCGHLTNNTRVMREGELEESNIEFQSWESSTSDNTQGIQINLMRAVVELLEQTLIEQKLTLTPNQKARVISAAYNHAIQAGATADTIQPQALTMAIDAVR
ncbi:hypothetical protein HMF8227_02341 [Saliniradius amylolyticus]|uniref:Uncharacterized protein n=1 Tax=Saliniradius amylolyticus TaxID=2183582 RepID=A0A2S2E582_9ALTE|nr:hypothetical protein [Saliniradius amylolyticus]AWL12793.1 hypothetical protein HMF8227_02341 [Saliniradius amylolyticus]